MAAENLMTGAKPDPLVRIVGLSKTYERKRGLFGATHRTQALEGVNLELARGKTIALVGESGSGKSTLARCLVRLEEPDGGEIYFDGRNLLKLEGEELRAARRQAQLVFQDPASALNPRFAAWEIIAEPLEILGQQSQRERREIALMLMDRVGLPRQSGDHRPEEFSGGQRQRLAIARALTLEPKLLILDEALSALDLSIQAQVVNLLLDLRAERGLTYLFITHDVHLAACLADEIAVMHEGRLVERGTPMEILREPRHEETRALVAAQPPIENLFSQRAEERQR